MQEVSLKEQFAMNIDNSRTQKKVELYEMRAKKNKPKRITKKVKAAIDKKAASLLKQFGLD